MYLRDVGPTEVGAFGVSAADDLLLIEDLHLVRQQTTAVTVAFEDAAVADYFDDRVDEGLPMERAGRIWVHSHPGDSAEPSWVDEQTFSRCFGGCSWAVMAILAKGGQTYARIRCAVGPGLEVVLAVEVDYSAGFPGSSQAAWAQEYERCVRPLPALPAQEGHRLWPDSEGLGAGRGEDDWYWGQDADWEALWTTEEELNALYN